MELLDSEVSTEYAMQCIKWCAENGEARALEEILTVHKNRFKDELIHVICDAFSKRRIGRIKIMLLALDQEIREMYRGDENSTLHKFLCCAIETGETDIAVDLIDKGAKVNGHFYGRPLLHLAACNGNLEVVRELVKVGADIHSVDRRGDGIINSILTSQLENKAPMVRQVINLGANPVIKSSSGKLPLHLASKNAPDVLVEILKDGYDVNAIDFVNAETPLHIACGVACRETIQVLIQSGCRFNMENNQGQTPLAKLLRFTKNDHDFHTKTRLGIAKVLISVGFRMNRQTKKTFGRYDKGRDKCFDRYVSLKMSLNSPPRLQSLARLTVRESLTLGACIEKEINKLDIPTNLKSFLMFRELKL